MTISNIKRNSTCQDTTVFQCSGLSWCHSKQVESHANLLLHSSCCHHGNLPDHHSLLKRMKGIWKWRAQHPERVISFAQHWKASFSERCKCNFAAWSLWEIFSCWDLCFCLGQLHQDTDREIETGGETMSEIDTAGVPSWGCLTGLFWVRCFLATSTSNVIRIYQICLNIWHPLNHLNTKVTVLPLLKMDVLGVVRRSRTFWKPHPICEYIVHQDAKGEQVSWKGSLNLGSYDKLKPHCQQIGGIYMHIISLITPEWIFDGLCHLFCSNNTNGPFVRDSWSKRHPDKWKLHAAWEQWSEDFSYKDELAKRIGINWVNCVILLMEEILHHLGCIKPCK